MGLLRVFIASVPSFIKGSIAGSFSLQFSNRCFPDSSYLESNSTENSTLSDYNFCWVRNREELTGCSYGTSFLKNKAGRGWIGSLEEGKIMFIEVWMMTMMMGKIVTTISWRWSLILIFWNPIHPRRRNIPGRVEMSLEWLNWACFGDRLMLICYLWWLF